ncbi:hypothetical protein JRA82_004598 [Raoultella ornithinolytica]|nr:hypothetical protein [Raoultella ornithinolytica]
METEIHHCYSCGGSFAREDLQYRPIGKGAYRKSAYYCPVCNEKEKKKQALKVAASSFRKSLPVRPGYLSHKRP